MPGAVARTSTQALVNATLPYGLAIACKGLEKACTDDKGLLEGLNCYNGKCTYQGVAEAFELEYTDPATLLGSNWAYTRTKKNDTPWGVSFLLWNSKYTNIRGEPAGEQGCFCKKAQKKRPMASKIKNIHWQTREGCARMIFHTVIVCPFRAIRPNMVILTQMGAVVKKKVSRFWQLRQAYQKHIIRKKGCDDPYGNGQGRNVRQDHA